MTVYNHVEKKRLSGAQFRGETLTNDVLVSRVCTCQTLMMSGTDSPFIRYPASVTANNV
jgi:hypothetical protein